MITLDTLDALVQHALSEGARAAEVLFERGSGHAITLAPGARPSTRSTAREQLTVRVWVDGGRVGVQRGPWDQGRDLVGQALASTFQSPEDPHAGPVGRIGSPTAGLGTADRRHAQLTAEDRLEAVIDAERQTKADARFRSTGFSYEDEASWRALVNSRGVRLEESATRYRLAGGLKGAGLELEEHLEGRAFASIASLPLGTQLVRRAQALLEDGEVLPAGPVRVVLTPLAMARVLDVLGECFVPERIADGSFFLAQDGPAPTGDLLHVVDDGSATGGLRTRAFDDRGVPPVPLTLIREGRVDARFLDPEAARALDTRPTGHVWGDRLGASNLLMRSGTRSINALLTELGGPSLLVDDLPDLSSLDLRTGALDVRVNGIVMAANKPVGAMRGVRLSGNLRDLLTQVVEVCSDTDRIGHVDASAIIANGLLLG